MRNDSNRETPVFARHARPDLLLFPKYAAPPSDPTQPPDLKGLTPAQSPKNLPAAGGP